MIVEIGTLRMKYRRKAETRDIDDWSVLEVLVEDVAARPLVVKA